MGHAHRHSSACIKADGSYCRELEAEIGIPPERSPRWERNVDPDALAYLEQGDEWDDPTFDNADLERKPHLRLV